MIFVSSAGRIFTGTLRTYGEYAPGHNINKTLKNMHLCSCYEKRNLDLHGLINK